MTTSRFPARRAGTMVCGHPIACMYRWRDEKGTHKYCMACLLEQSGLKDVESMTEEYRESIHPTNIDTVSNIITPATLITDEEYKPDMTDFEEPGVTLGQIGVVDKEDRKALDKIEKQERKTKVKKTN